jgi:hypothetical protein
MNREPLSWLLLERYELGELTATERLDVEARLAESESDRACLAQIRADQTALPALPALPAKAAQPASQPGKVHTLPRRRGTWIVVSTGLCAAAALLLLVRMDNPGSGSATTSAVESDPGIKGGSEVVLRLSGEHQGASPRHFGQGERFKVEVTCPPRLSDALRLFVFQDGEVFEPLPLTAPLACGNLVPWPGAFALDGAQPADVCVAWAANLGAVTRASDLGEMSSCTRLSPP